MNNIEYFNSASIGSTSENLSFEAWLDVHLAHLRVLNRHIQLLGSVDSFVPWRNILLLIHDRVACLLHLNQFLIEGLKGIRGCLVILHESLLWVNVTHFSLVPVLVSSVQEERPLVERNHARLGVLGLSAASPRVWPHESEDWSLCLGFDVFLEVLVSYSYDLVLKVWSWIIWDWENRWLLLKHWVLIDHGFLLQEEFFYFSGLLLRVSSVLFLTWGIDYLCGVVVWIGLSDFISPMHDFVVIHLWLSRHLRIAHHLWLAHHHLRLCHHHLRLCHRIWDVAIN